MFLPLSFLKNYLESDLSLKEIIQTLTDLGIEVEKVENSTPAFSNVVIAEVKKVQKHPSADKLQIALVFDGADTYQVVCGASNCRANLKTAFARPGAEITEKGGKTFKIKKAKLRGIESYGMLCSEKELKISQEDSGIMEIEQDLPLGADLAKYFHDPVLELSLTPNLGHCLSAIGIARELAAGTKQRVKYPPVDFVCEQNLTTSQKAKIDIKDSRCLRYSGLYVQNITVGPSPKWLSSVLEKSGFKSVNNIVDITNFVLLETGQPLHAFDLGKIADSAISVEASVREERFLGLNQIEYLVPKNTLLIKDKEKILALGGILGGEESSVSSNTKNIFLESACFDPAAVRKSCLKLGLRTESSLRFEKATDPDATVFALKRAAYLLKQVCPEAGAACDFIDLKQVEFPQKTIYLSREKACRILGLDLNVNEMADFLKRLELKVEKTEKKGRDLKVAVPTFRNDLNEEIDLIEEIARLYGYNRIEKPTAYFTSSPHSSSAFYLFEQNLKKNLISQGVKEIITPDLISFEMADITHEKEIPSDAILKVKKAKSRDTSFLRPTLLASHLQVVKHNQDRKNFDLFFFEASKVHIKKEKIIEEPVLALTFSGSVWPAHFSLKQSAADFFDLKGSLENLLKSLNISDFTFEKTADSYIFHPGRQAHLLIEGKKAATLGAVHPGVLRKLDIENEVYFAELNSHLLFQFKKDSETSFTPLPAFPSTERDWTFSWQKEVPVQELFKEIDRIRPALLEHFYLLDLYRDKKEKSSYNLTLRFVYRDLKKTVSFEEAQKAHAKITGHISKKFLSA